MQSHVTPYRTAVLISGHMRSFERCLPTQIDHVYRHLGAVDFFVSTVRDNDSHTAELLRQRYPKSRVEIEVIDCQPEIPIPVQSMAADWQAGQNRLYTHEPYAISVHPQAILRQLWHLQRVWDFAVAAGFVPAAYDRIVRARPDLYFRSAAGMRRFMAPNIALTPWWGRFGGVNDRFALLGWDSARAYFNTFGKISELIAKGYPLHPERLVYASLVESGCEVEDTLCVEFAKLIWDQGPQHGHFRDPEITLIDLAHTALRL